MLSNGTVGAIGEIKVAEDLMSRGFSVFRSLGPNGPVDLVAVSPRGKPHLVQVTVGRPRNRGRYGGFDPHRDVRVWNVLAICYPDKIEYRTRDDKAMHFSRGELVVGERVPNVRRPRQPRIPKPRAPTLHNQPPMSAEELRESGYQTMWRHFKGERLDRLIKYGPTSLGGDRPGDLLPRGASQHPEGDKVAEPPKHNKDPPNHNFLSVAEIAKEVLEEYETEHNPARAQNPVPGPHSYIPGDPSPDP